MERTTDELMGLIRAAVHRCLRQSHVRRLPKPRHALELCSARVFRHTLAHCNAARHSRRRGFRTP